MASTLACRVERHGSGTLSAASIRRPATPKRSVTMHGFPKLTSVA